MDSDGKEHKKRSDKLGEQYTRQAIEETLLVNKQKRQNKQQPPVLSMSDWIQLRQEEEREKEQTHQEKAEPIQSPVISVVPQLINTAKTESKQELEMQKEIVEQQKLSRSLQKDREYQQLLKERQSIQLQLEQLKKITEDENDACLDEDYAKRDSTERKLWILENKIKRLRATHTPEEKLNENLLPNTPTLSKDIGMSL